MTCSLSRSILIAWAVGLLVMTVTGSEVAAWLTAGVVVAAVVAFGRLNTARGDGAACGMPRRVDEDERSLT